MLRLLFTAWMSSVVPENLPYHALHQLLDFQTGTLDGSASFFSCVFKVFFHWHAHFMGIGKWPRK